MAGDPPNSWVFPSDSRAITDRLDRIIELLEAWASDDAIARWRPHDAAPDYSLIGAEGFSPEEIEHMIASLLELNERLEQARRVSLDG